MNYQRMIEILQGIKLLRSEGNNDSPYVCDNIAEVTGSVWEDGVDEDEDEENIRADIKEYIDGAFGLHDWMNKRDGTDYDRDDEEVHKERIIMIDALIQRYTTKLQENTHESN